MMSIALTAPLPQLVDAAELLTHARAVAAICAEHAGEGDREGGYPATGMARLAEAGLLTAPLPVEHGGLGLGFGGEGSARLLRLLTILGSGDLCVARLYEGHANALLLARTFGTTAQLARAAADARTGRLFAVWNTQGADGLRLESDEHGHRLAGGKTFASGAGWVERPLVTAALPDGGWQMLLLDLTGQPAAIDQSGWRPTGMRGSASGRIDLSGLPVDAETAIGAAGDYYRQPWFGGGAIRFVAAQLGGAVAAIDAARADLRAHGRAEDAAQRERIGLAAAGIETGLLLLERAATLAGRSRLGGAEPPDIADDELVAYVNLCRIAVERICLEAIEVAQRSVGVRAFLAPHPLERIARDLTTYLRQPAPDAALQSAGAFALGWEGSLLDGWGRA